MEVTLEPETKLQPRYWTLGVVIVLILVTPLFAWWFRVLFCFLPVALIGTYRISTVNGDRFRSQSYFAFMPLKPVKCNLPGVIYVETKFNGSGSGSFLAHYCGFLVELLIPIFGGTYEIWLITAKDREIEAWQGTDQRHFEANVALLQSRTGAEVRGRSK